MMGRVTVLFVLGGFGLGVGLRRAGEPGGGKALPHHIENTLMEGGDRGFSGEDDDAARVTLCDLAVLLVDTVVELVVLTFEAVLIGAQTAGGSVIASTGAAQRGGEGWEEKNGQVRQDVVADRSMQGEDAV